MFEGLLRSLAAAGQEIAAEAHSDDEKRPASAASPTVGREPTLEELEALEDEIEEEEEEGIDADEPRVLLGSDLDDDPAPAVPDDESSGARGGSPEALLAKLLGNLDGELVAEPEPEPEPTTTVQLIQRALDRALTRLTSDELVELTHLDQREELLEELLDPVLLAPSLDDALRAALEGLVDSEHVEEVYGEDAELLGILRQAFEAVNREAIAGD